MKGTTARWLALVLLVSAVLRLYLLDIIPPGISTDEGINGVFALNVLAGDRPIVFEPDSREPFFLYLAAASVAVFGPTPLALRIPAALAGIGLTLAVFLAGRRLFGSGTGLLAAAAFTAGYWPLQLSREGFRAITMPLLETLSIYFLWRGLKTRSLASFALAGAFLAGTLYTYPSGRLAPVLALAFLAIVALADRRLISGNWRGLVVAALAGILIAAPLVVYYLAHPESFTGRLATASATGGLDPAGLLRALGDNLLPTLGMFSFHGDSQWKYNLPGQPVFGLTWSLLFYAGILTCLKRLRSPEYALLPAWLAVGVLPGAMSGESPHFMRTVGAMPAAYLLAAVGLKAVGDWLALRLRPALVAGAAAVLLIATVAMTCWQYFGLWAGSLPVSYYFYQDMAAAARFLNDHEGSERVVLSAEYHDLHQSMMRYLLSPRPRQITWLDARRSLVLPTASGSETLYVLPASAAAPGSAVSQLLPAASVVHEETRPDGEPLLRVLRAAPSSGTRPATALRANLGGLVQLTGFSLEGEHLAPGQPARLTLFWEVLREAPQDAAASYRFFIQVTDSGGYLWAQDDGIGLVTPDWRAGDSVATYLAPRLPADAPPGDYAISVGLYSPQEAQPVSILDERGAPAGVALQVATVPLARSGAAAPVPQPPNAITLASGGLELRGYGLARRQLGPGESLRVDLYWRAVSPSADPTVRLELAGPVGAVQASWQGTPVKGFPLPAWQPGEAVRQWYDIAVPPDCPPGEYGLTVSFAGQQASLGTVRVAGRPRSFTVPGIQHPHPARVGGFAELLGYAVDRDLVAHNGSVTITLYWRALAPAPEAYTVFVHLLDGQSRLWGQRDAQPLGGAAPTTSWLAGEVITDAYTVVLNPGTPPGQFDIEIGMYVAKTGARLPVTDDAKPLGDHLIVGRITVEP